MKNNKLFIAIIVIVALVALKDKPANPQAIGYLECFADEDCLIPVPENYCGVNYGCTVGRCYNEPILCPEVCDSGRDEDLDGNIDCQDSDCWQSIDCHCDRASFGSCKVGRCFCPEGQLPQWTVAETNYCGCY